MVIFLFARSILILGSLEARVMLTTELTKILKERNQIFDAFIFISCANRQ